MFLFLLLLSAACRQRYEQDMKQAIRIAENQPDSAMKMLERLDRQGFSDSERALYALAYTLSQDKSGLDVDNDSLIRTAYDYYVQNPKDSLYGKCMYYMGKYYMLNDSMAQATFCFRKAQIAATALKDTSSLCLTMHMLSYSTLPQNPQVAMAIGDSIIALYSAYSKSTPSNRIFFTLNKTNCLAFNGNPQQALQLARELLPVAVKLNDSVVLSSIYQEMALYADLANLPKQAVHYGLLSFKYKPHHDYHLMVNLAGVYLNSGLFRECLQLLDSLPTKTMKAHYVQWSLRQQVKQRQKRYDEAWACSDSAQRYMEMAYYESLDEKKSYYSMLMQKNADKIKVEAASAKYKLTTGFVTVLILVLLAFAATVYVGLKRNARTQRKFHEAKLESNLKQMVLMKRLILQRLDFVQVLQREGNAFAEKYRMDEKDWEELEIFLNLTQNEFVSRLRMQFQNLEENDIRLLMLLRLKLPAKTLANIYGISYTSIKQNLFIFKKKIGLESGQQSVRQFIEQF